MISRPDLAVACYTEILGAARARSVHSVKNPLSPSSPQVVEGGPDATLPWARFMSHRAERTLFSQDDREHRQTAELEDALMSDERPENNREERLAL
jgi:hypothetical protein